MKANEIEELLRYERGDLPVADVATWANRIAQGGEARRWFTWIQALRLAAEGKASQAGAPAPDPMDVAELAEGLLEPAAARRVRAQLLACDDGLGMLEAALEECAAREEQVLPGADSDAFDTFDADPGPLELIGTDAAMAPSPRRSWVGVFAAAAAVVLLALAGRSLWSGGSSDAPGEAGLGGNDQRVAGLAEREAMPAPTLRSALASGLEDYRADRFGAAAEALRAQVDENPTDGPAWLYLGSAYLMEGRDAEARQALERAVEHCEGSFAPEAAWQLAQARLAMEDRAGATELLRSLSETRRSSAAADKLKELDELGLR